MAEAEAATYEEGEDEEEKREIGKLAVWTVTSAKPGNGVELMRDDNLETYWQSDGAQPHLVNIQFQKKVKLQQIAIYIDFKLDESYTPSKISVRLGNSFHDLREIRQVDLEEPVGWIYISLRPNDSSSVFLRAYLVQVAVLASHQNGRDTHMRQVKIYGPRTDVVRAMGHPMRFTSEEFNMYATIR
ncbi:Anaphase-promoting complex subunit 10 [Klebsormidium nitens]|uniref:Anaphase-promoting complex subunit 10 n=1 Tax=Klebsormidium nitens TaxID=105231 RepID=A0A0U9HIY2_KLENI|nr:Anaphase-promoting complex subunit 10 [Klebsormidium nitens]|eukprot:GAQ80988.1 Anaphase-promoting complex subunit 10 [Klebsormidium nitens]